MGTIVITVPVWNIEAETGYTPMTTFYSDFSIADKFGIESVTDTFNRAFDECKADYKYLTELVLVLNWKIYEHFEKNDDLAILYNTLWGIADEWAVNNLQGDELEYFYKTTD